MENSDNAISPELAASRKWFREAQFGMMVHWGLYSMLGGEWRGERMTEIAEWVQQYFRIPNAEYHALAKAFNPILFNADEWVQLVRDAGMKYLVVTSKHHEGFAMYKSKVSSFNIVDATPFGRDVIGELAEACRKHGIKLGLYYSQDLDWSDPDGGGYTEGKTWGKGKAYWTNNWDFPDTASKNFTRYFENKSLPQVEEIVTQYGDLCLLWFDCAYTISPEQSRQLYNLVRKHQPGALINSRIGNNMGDYKSAGDNVIPETDRGGILYESPATLNDTWGYKYFDDNWKSAEKVIAIKRHLKSIGANYLLNVGPDHLGRIPGPAIDILRAVGKADN